MPTATKIRPYQDAGEVLIDEMRYLDLFISGHVAKLRSGNSGDRRLRGLVIADEEIDALLHGTAPGPLPDDWQAAVAQLGAEISVRKSVSSSSVLRLERLATLFGLGPLDLDILRIALAPEFDLRYERLYAYLQDDVTRKWPTVDLALNLACASRETKLVARQRLDQNAPLLACRLLQLFDDPAHHQPPFLSKYMKLDERIVSYILGCNDVDARLAACVRHVIPVTRLDDLELSTDVARNLKRLVDKHGVMDQVFYFQGPYGVGKQTVASALCAELGLGLLIVDGERLLHLEESAFEPVVRLIHREARLQGAAIFWRGFDGLLADDKSARRQILLEEVARWRWMTILTGQIPWDASPGLHSLPFLRIELSRPGYADRLRLWAISLNGDVSQGSDVDLCALATKFKFSGGQIRDAAVTARHLALWRDPQHMNVTMADLSEACRLQSNRRLALLARKIAPHYTWPDIVLPSDRLQQLREVCNYARYRARVYDEWGFDRKLSLGKGINILFTGPSGTGKTMAAEVVANELGLDLYKIDLSTVVSKYIGETEKNLARVFAEAETSNAILFFDEADALFGKRSEVRDAHDRYANIEISYLLQKMEEYEGIVILATNLRKNMDEAFVRRMHFTVEFPFPIESSRRRIWETIWPEETPRSHDLDLDYVARQFEIAGGNIRNIALAAAFLAAADGGEVNMRHLLHATRREYQKIGKVVAEDEFAPHASWTSE